jgi:hypothetical protein
MGIGLCEDSLAMRAIPPCGFMLALDQVLRKHWSCLTTFGTLTGWSKMEHPGEVEIAGSHLFCLWTQQRVLGFM